MALVRRFPWQPRRTIHSGHMSLKLAGYIASQT